MSERFSIPTVRGPKKPDPETHPWYWNPDRLGVRSAPWRFTESLHRVGEELEVTWNPLQERWQVWERCPRLQHPLCQGWRLLFIHSDVDKGYLPLDERLFARLYYASADAWGSGKEYFNRLMSEMERDKERAAKQDLQDTLDLAMPSFEHSQIKVGYGSSNGSKFADYHS